MSHWNLANKAFPARAPTVGTDHVGGDGSFIDKYKASGVKQPLLADPASALPRHVGSLSLCGAQAFFNSDAVTSEKSGERAGASRNSPLVQCQDDLIQCEVWWLAVERKDLLGLLLQWRSASAARHRFASPVLAKALHPPDGGTDADVELFSRFTAGTSCFNKADDPPSQFTRIRSTHWLVPRESMR
jgi:hypothetical protein